MNAIAASFRKAMDALYFACVLIAGSALVLISAVIPWGVYTRYVLNSAASWPEPAAVSHERVVLREIDAGLLATFLRCARRSSHDRDVCLHDRLGSKARYRHL